MTTKTKAPNPQDATLRNVRAAVKRLAVLEKRVKVLERGQTVTARLLARAFDAS